MPKEINRREMLAAVLPVPFMPLVLGALAPRKPVQDDYDDCSARWTLKDWGHGLEPHYLLLVGPRLKHSSEDHGSLEGLLCQCSAGSWWFRVGTYTTSFAAPDLETAKRRAEQQMVEWVRASLVELEKYVFPIMSK